MKKNITRSLAVLLLVSCLFICGHSDGPAYADKENLQIVATIFPEYDWVMNILGENPAGMEVTLLLDRGVDLHSYQPSAADILKISSSDLFIYVGGESDDWVEDVLLEAVNKDMVVINLLSVLGDSALEEELTEGMEEEAHDHDHGEEDDHHDHEDAEYDEHVWLSLRNASVLTEALSSALQSIDPDNADTYAENAASYREALASLDSAYETCVSEASVRTLLFGDRFPFRYMTEDYGLSYYAAFPGCSAETEASFQTVMFLAQKLDELSLHSVITIDGASPRIAETIIQNTRSGDQQILTLNSMQSVSARDIENGVTYLSIMENNLSVLQNALK